MPGKSILRTLPLEIEDLVPSMRPRHECRGRAGAVDHPKRNTHAAFNEAPARMPGKRGPVIAFGGRYHASFNEAPARMPGKRCRLPARGATDAALQ